MNYSSIFKKVAKDSNLPLELIEHTYKSYWGAIRDIISELPLKEELSEEEFSRLRPSFCISSLGKLAVTYNRYKGMKQRQNYRKDD